MLKGLLLIDPQIFSDERGFFLESYRADRLPLNFVQDNLSFSKKDVIRGLHFQSGEGQGKLIQVVRGVIFDVAVDIRPDSPTFLQWEGVVLDDRKRQQFFIPAGFAHGFCVLSDEALVHYKVSSYFAPELEKGFRYDDPEIGIEWPTLTPILSKRDQEAPYVNAALDCR